MFLHLTKNFMRKKTLLFALLIGSFGLCLAAVAADLNGKWSCVLNAPTGDQYPINYVFKIDGSSIAGTLETNGVTVPIDSGKVKGDSVFFSITFQGRPYPHKGKYYPQGDSVGMDVDFGSAKAHATLTRTP
jgi:hypothetical protein